MKRLTEKHILQMHSLLIQETGGSEGVKDRRLLDSALNLPFQTFNGEDIYKTIRAKASRLAFSIINNHPFVDGNKRIGILSMIVFLEINGIEVDCTDDELIELGLGLASGKIDYGELLNWIIEKT